VFFEIELRKQESALGIFMMQTGWKRKQFEECLMPVKHDRTKQIQAHGYKNEGEFPIIDQGQKLISGWTNNKSLIVKEILPLIIFGDHTRVFKFVDFPFAIGADGTKLLKPKEDELYARFFYYYLLTLNIPSKGYNRHYKVLKEKEIYYPPLPEQQKIAAILFKIQQAIEVQESIIERMQELKKATMQHVFTYGLRGEKTKETEIGRVPESWEVIQIGDLGEIITGTTPPTSNSEYYEEGGYQFIAPVDLGKTTKIYQSAKEITESGLKVSRVLPKNSVCFVCIGSTIGKVGITVAEKATTNQQINTIITNDSFDPFFVTYLLDFKSGYIASFASPSPVPILSKGKFEEIQIMVSSDKQEQQEIAHILKTLDEKIELHETKKSALQELFKTMLNKLMTGEIRVRDLEINLAKIIKDEVQSG
jgi:type I restriction enzyme S subunit